MTKLVACDTETTSLRWDRRIWEVGLIVRPDHRSREGETEHRWFVDRQDLDLGNADLFSLNIGRYFDRHPQEADGDVRYVLREAVMLRAVERLCRGAHILGNIVNFDTEALAARGRANNVLWSGHYHLIECEALAVGYLLGRSRLLEAEQADLAIADLSALPWDSEMLSRWLDVKVPEDRHAALADARWGLDMYDRVMGIE